MTNQFTPSAAAMLTKQKLDSVIKNPPAYIPDVVITSIRATQSGPNPMDKDLCERAYRLLADKKEMPKVWKQLSRRIKNNDGLLMFFLLALDGDTYYWDLSEWNIDWDARAEQHKKVAAKASALLEAMGESPRLYFTETLFNDLNFICCPDWENEGRHNYRDPELWDRFYNTLAAPTLPYALKLLNQCAQVASKVGKYRKPGRKIRNFAGDIHPNAKRNFLIHALGQIVNRHSVKSCHALIARTVNIAEQLDPPINGKIVKDLLNR